MVCEGWCYGDSCGWQCNDADGKIVADCASGASYLHDKPCHDHCMANGLTTDGTECDYGMICDYYCFGSSCGWECKEDGKTVADCANGESHLPGGSCDDTCMANGIAPGTPNEYDGRACPVPDSDTAGSTSDTDTAGSNVTETDTAGSDAATGDSSDKTE